MNLSAFLIQIGHTQTGVFEAKAILLTLVAKGLTIITKIGPILYFGNLRLGKL